MYVVANAHTIEHCEEPQGCGVLLNVCVASFSVWQRLNYDTNLGSSSQFFLDECQIFKDPFWKDKH